jgi:hypothetical protein
MLIQGVMVLLVVSFNRALHTPAENAPMGNSNVDPYGVTPSRMR